MIFLRKRNNEFERAWMPNDFTATERGHALFVLNGAVIIVRHPYDRDPGSGSGNCWCGRDQSHKLHDVVVED